VSDKYHYKERTFDKLTAI